MKTELEETTDRLKRLMAEFDNRYIKIAIYAAAVILGLVVQFMMKSREIGRKEVKHSKKVKEEISIESEIDKARSVLDFDDEDIPSDDDNVEHGYYDEYDEFDTEYEKTMRNLSLMANLKDYMASGKEWVLDSGCTDHMTGDKDMFHEIIPNHGAQRYVTF